MLFQLRKDNKTLLQKIEEYTTTCNTKGEFHRDQAKHSSRWWNFLGVLNVVLVASQALALTIQASLGDSGKNIAIVGGSFSFCIVVFNRVQMAFAFNCLSIEHHNLADDFQELGQRFRLLVNDVEKEEFEEKDYENCVNRYISVNEKTHLQNVSKMKIFYCCCEK